MKYRDDLEPALKGISFSIKGGENVGICGRTGAGKSSIMYSLFRLQEVSELTECLFFTFFFFLLPCLTIPFQSHLRLYFDCKIFNAGFLQPTEGQILIDGVDISKIGLEPLRSNLIIIPQDPVIFSGTSLFFFTSENSITFQSNHYRYYQRQQKFLV
jgi:ABC-type bacteriocin/lantibiotic exporter with double-glycine peptidase domain